MGKTSLLLLFLFLQTQKYVHARFYCYGDFFTVKYGFNRDYLFSSLPSNVVTNGGFYNASLGRDSDRVHVAALCKRGYEKQACQKCLEDVIEDTKSWCPNQKEFFSWVTIESDEGFCSLRYTNHSTFGKLELSPFYIIPNPIDIDSSKIKNMTRLSQEWMEMANHILELASTAETSSVLKYYEASRTEFTEVPDVYALMQCTPDLSPSDCKRCLRECVDDFQKQSWGKQGGGVGRPSCYFRWDFFPFYKAFGNFLSVRAPPPPPSPQASLTTQDYGRDKKGFKGRNIAFITIPILFIFIGLFCYWRKKLTHTGIEESLDSIDCQSMLRFDLGTILTATNDFSFDNKLGQGGFGSVYKGILPNGQEIAVKRLRKGSGQGDTEFKNEVSLLARLQHKNLVKLLGFCNKGDEMILVYELVPNSSLDHFIFDEDKRALLTWEMRFKIIEGVARGFVYLHEDSRMKIIHRDLKASNILLDAKMNPKVADFGTARLFDTDETRAETRRIAGTRGYMAPEYLIHGQMSAKSDVYSFGVMLLEMISGERNNSFEGEGLPAFAWKRWVEGKPEIIIDRFLIDSPRNEITKLIQIGLLCVQENVTKRPTMSSVMDFLDSETINIPLPKAPAFTSNQSQTENGTMSMSKIFTELSCR